MDEKARKAASVRDRLKKRAMESGRPYMELQQYYAMEKFLLRLSKSKHADAYALKGALLLRSFGVHNSRFTRDIDLATYRTISLAEAENFVRTCLMETEVEEDGLNFYSDSIRAEEIRELQSYTGIRVSFLVSLGTARINMQIDIGFGDVITPDPVLIELPQVLDESIIRINGYTLETAIAEKFEAMISLDMANSRMKDFYDIWYLSSAFSFEMPSLARAIQATFNRRQTILPEENPTAFSKEFADIKQMQWQAFFKKNGLTEPPTHFDDLVNHIKAFIMPVLQEIRKQEIRISDWSPGSGWQ